MTINGYIHKELNIKVTDSDITTDIETALIEQDSTMVGNFREHSVSCLASLGGKREIIVYLPSDYYTNTSKKYPVLYMHDAQVIFRGLAIDNEWKVDNAIETYIKEGKTQGVIVVGLKNTGNRNAEYCPWQFYDGSESIGGLGDEYLDFIVNNLKPFIDTNYRTKSDRENTGIAGSSLGGLISFYGGIKHQDTFGIIGAFSSSFECKNREIVKYLEQIPNKYSSRIYIDAGNNEGYMVSDANLVYDKLVSLGYKSDNLKKVIDPTGSHTISSWQKRFPDAFLWMFDGK
ncbi:MAG: hypothetical protein A2Z98_03730 [Spirochaetes bacterium GWB1_27_13]|nr:MAG: hypothetical protein A2Z98_03730 [Spirochaetes bacterium GWB1_27_13]